MSGRAWQDRLPDPALALAVFVTPVLGVVDSLALAVVLPVLSVCFLSGDMRSLLRGAGWYYAVLASLGLWAVWSLSWSPAADHGASVLLRALGLGLAGVPVLARMTGLSLDRALTFGALGVAVGALVLLAEYSTGNSLSSQILVLKGSNPKLAGAKSGFNRGATLLAVLLWPLAYAAWRRGQAWLWAVVGIGLLSILIGDSVSGKLALAAGAGGLAAVLLLPRFGPRLLALVLAVVVLAVPVLSAHLPVPPESFQSHSALPLSAHHRLAIWSFTGEQIALHPWRGWGMDASRALPGGDDPLDLRMMSRDGIVLGVIDGPRMPLHPHNALLQVSLELGLPGQLVLIALLGFLLAGIGRHALFDRVGGGMLAASLMAGLTVASVSYGVWQNWWLASLWMGVIYCRLALAEGPRDRSVDSPCR